MKGFDEFANKWKRVALKSPETVTLFFSYSGLYRIHDIVHKIAKDFGIGYEALYSRTFHLMGRVHITKTYKSKT